LQVEYSASLVVAKTRTELRRSEEHPQAAFALAALLSGSSGRTPIDAREAMTSTAARVIDE